MDPEIDAQQPAASRSGFREWIRRRASLLAIDPLERQYGGRAGGIIYIVAGLSGLVHPLLPDASNAHPAWLLGVSLVALVWGGLTVSVIDWRRMDPLYTHLSTFAAYAAIGIGVWASGGDRSFAWIYLVWIALFGCYFYTPQLAIFYVVVSILVQAAPLVYDTNAIKHGFLSQLVVSAAGYAAIGVLVSKGKRMVVTLRNQSETLAAEQGALQRAASAVIRGEHPDTVFKIIASEFSPALRGNIGGVSQIVGDETVKVVSLWTDDAVGEPREQLIGVEFNVGDVLDRLRAGRVITVAAVPPDSVAGHFGCRSALYAPVIVEGELWGLLGLGALDPDHFTSRDSERIEAFSALLAHIISSLGDRARLERQALTDQLTGLANHRDLHQRLEADLRATARSRRPLSIALIDLDNFKEINDVAGHDRGDAALRMVAGCLRDAARSGDTVGRLGGDEFMWIMPDTDSAEGRHAVERVRSTIAARPFDPRRATASAGICDNASSQDATELMRRADVALYASKAAGRNRTTVYDPDATQAARAREQWVERSQALSGLRALARAIDAKDPATSEHSERVSRFAARLAQAAGWPAERVDRLREAALVHDLGKLGIPDALLTKPDRLTAEERAIMNSHAELSARIVDNVLSEEQVSWIRMHHERPDGNGYPLGLTAAEIPDGAAFIALADAWDVMTVGRAYSEAKTLDATYEECVALSGTQFCSDAIAALQVLAAAGRLEP